MMKTVTITAGEIIERARELNEKEGLDPWTALGNAAYEARDKIDELEEEVGDILHALEWDPYEDKPDWDEVLRRARGDT